MLPLALPILVCVASYSALADTNADGALHAEENEDGQAASALASAIPKSDPDINQAAANNAATEKADEDAVEGKPASFGWRELKKMVSWDWGKRYEAYKVMGEEKQSENAHWPKLSVIPLTGERHDIFDVRNLHFDDDRDRQSHLARMRTFADDLPEYLIAQIRLNPNATANATSEGELGFDTETWDVVSMRDLVEQRPQGFFKCDHVVYTDWPIGSWGRRRRHFLHAQAEWAATVPNECFLIMTAAKDSPDPFMGFFGRFQAAINLMILDQLGVIAPATDGNLPLTHAAGHSAAAASAAAASGPPEGSAEAPNSKESRRPWFLYVDSDVVMTRAGAGVAQMVRNIAQANSNPLSLEEEFLNMNSKKDSSAITNSSPPNSITDSTYSTDMSNLDRVALVTANDPACAFKYRHTDNWARLNTGTLLFRRSPLVTYLFRAVVLSWEAGRTDGADRLDQKMMHAVLSDVFDLPDETMRKSCLHNQSLVGAYLSRAAVDPVLYGPACRGEQVLFRRSFRPGKFKDAEINTKDGDVELKQKLAELIYHYGLVNSRSTSPESSSSSSSSDSSVSSDPSVSSNVSLASGGEKGTLKYDTLIHVCNRLLGGSLQSSPYRVWKDVMMWECGDLGMHNIGSLFPGDKAFWTFSEWRQTYLEPCKDLLPFQTSLNGKPFYSSESPLLPQDPSHAVNADLRSIIERANANPIREPENKGSLPFLALGSNEWRLTSHQIPPTEN